MPTPIDPCRVYWGKDSIISCSLSYFRLEEREGLRGKRKENGVLEFFVEKREGNERSGRDEISLFCLQNSTLEGITTDAKRKWQEFYLQAENDAKDNADFSAAKHCSMELLLQKCVDTNEKALKHSKKTHESMTDMGQKHVSAIDTIVRGMKCSAGQYKPFKSKGNVTVFPVIGILWDKQAFTLVLNAEEVESIIYAPLEMFLKNENRRQEEKEVGGDKFLHHYFYHKTNGKVDVIRALTAGILIDTVSLVFRRPSDFQRRMPKFWNRIQKE
ncbi:hypothetical protein L1887_12569 [Cichorium endivia]|nr:hypothetical protein L1887_12569 [Cichorium endivia]